MNKFNYKFKQQDPEMCYKPKPKRFSFYQICSMRNPITNKYTVRKFVYNEMNEIVDEFVKEYGSVRLTKFIKNSPENKYKLYATYDLDIIGYPTSGDVFNAQSDLLK